MPGCREINKLSLAQGVPVLVCISQHPRGTWEFAAGQPQKQMSLSRQPARAEFAPWSREIRGRPGLRGVFPLLGSDFNYND